jgi:hypothetical protein
VIRELKSEIEYLEDKLTKEQLRAAGLNEMNEEQVRRLKDLHSAADSNEWSLGWYSGALA